MATGWIVAPQLNLHRGWAGLTAQSSGTRHSSNRGNKPICPQHPSPRSTEARVLEPVRAQPTLPSRSFYCRVCSLCTRGYCRSCIYRTHCFRQFPNNRSLCCLRQIAAENATVLTRSVAKYSDDGNTRLRTECCCEYLVFQLILSVLEVDSLVECCTNSKGKGVPILGDLATWSPVENPVFTELKTSRHWRTLCFVRRTSFHDEQTWFVMKWASCWDK